jgi:hypothetical protein
MKAMHTDITIYFLLCTALLLADLGKYDDVPAGLGGVGFVDPCLGMVETPPVGEDEVE